jgi:hypothetical protein
MTRLFHSLHLFTQPPLSAPAHPTATVCTFSPNRHSLHLLNQPPLSAPVHLTTTAPAKMAKASDLANIKSICSAAGNKIGEKWTAHNNPVALVR